MAGGFESKRVGGSFPDKEEQQITGAVNSVNGHTGDVTLTASDVGVYSRGESDNNYEGKRSTGVIGAADDPTKKPEGDYYVNEKFIGAPVIASNQYIGVMRIDLDFDGSDNGGLIEYITADTIFYKPKFAGGWASDWIEAPKAQAAMARTLSALGAEETTLEAKVAELESKVTELEKHSSAPKSGKFDPLTVALTAGYADNWQGAIHVSTHKTGSPITVTKVSDEPHNAVVMMAPEAASHVTGITIDGGLPAKWESHGVTIDGKQYTAFISPYKLTKHPLSIGIVWG
ncbi:coil containing protein [Vibrio phage 1.179.O._10N.286.45.F12]|nr:coil containing protein [Vibrio phage 1.179.O._10N.286.45.F12]